jgi:diguanylate cyclase (GGDEF)-like protein
MMDYVATGAASAFLISSVVPLAAALHVVRNRSGSLAGSLIRVFLAAAVWCLANALEDSAQLLSHKVFWSQVGYLGVLGTPMFLMCFALEFHRGRPASMWLRAALGGLPLVTLVLVFTNGWHGWIWPEVTLLQDGAGRAFYHRGSWFWVNVANLYAYLMWSTVLLLMVSFRNRFIFRRQSLLFLAAVPLPWFTSILYLLRASPIANVDMTPIAMGVTSVLLYLAVHRFGLADVIPVARDVVFDNLCDGLVVLDDQGRLLDVNRGAVQLLGLSGPIPVGQIAATVHPLLTTDRVGEVEVETEEGSGRYISLQFNPFTATRRSVAGTIVVIRDVTDRVSMAFLLEEQKRDLERLAMTDSLTGLYNRRHATHALETECARARRYTQPLSVAMLDLDHFKQVNDVHGHATGDRVLKAAADAMVAAVRGTDVVARWGGEEFVVILPHSGDEYSEKVVERVRRAVQEAIKERTGLDVTLSAGLADYLTGESIDGLLDRADGYLYQAKAQGRDRLVRGVASPMVDGRRSKVASATAGVPWAVDSNREL